MEIQALIQLVMMVSALVIATRFLHAYNRYVTAFVERNTDTNPTTKYKIQREKSYATDTPHTGATQNYAIQELPPEVIAPTLKNPPRVPGGFGSKVR